MCCESQFKVNFEAKVTSNATENLEVLTNNRENHKGTGMSLEMKRISAAMGIGEDLNNAIAIISLQSVSVVMIFSLVI